MRFLTLLLFVVSNFVSAQELYPPSWWTNMKWNQVQILIRNDEPFTNEQITTTYAGVRVVKSTLLENKKYATLDVAIAPTAKPGTVKFKIGKKEISWMLNARRADKGKAFAQGLSQADVVYLIMPDRFSNGETANDKIAGLRDQSLNRDSIYLRHGGDLQGVIQHLDYLQSLGVTAVWLNPVLLNDMPNRTEHGYAITHHYTVDPRLGGDAMYKKLSDELHKRGMKLIQDAVYNHAGYYHPLVQDKPVKDWLHEWPTYTNTNWREQTHFDTHGAPSDKKLMTDGWFVPMMPDLNHENKIQANFLIQHALWCVEEFGLDAWRIDTYTYNNLDFMNRCNQALYDEYPKMFLFGEAMVHSVLSQAYFTLNNFKTPFKSNLTSVCDFQSTFYGIVPALTNQQDGLGKLYNIMASDFVYQHPENLVIFLDNHDISRIFTLVNEDVRKQKLGFGWLLTNRGIPQIYYGSEVLMKGNVSPRDGEVRHDFPGGWSSDKKNAFTGQGLTADEKSMLDFVKKLGQFRKTSPALTKGSMYQYTPKDDVYAYLRKADNQTILVAMNVSEKAKTISLKDYAEHTKGFTTITDVMTGKKADTQLTIEPMSILIGELSK